MRSNHAGFLIDIDQESVGARDLLEESNSNGSSNPAALSVRKSRQSLFARIRLKQAASPIYAPSWESRSIGHVFPTHCAAARALAQRMSCLRMFGAASPASEPGWNQIRPTACLSNR